MRISDDDSRRAVTALKQRFGDRYAGIRVDGTSHPPYHLRVRLAGREEGDHDEVLRLLRSTLPGISEPDLTWSIVSVRFGLADLEEALDAVDTWIRPRMLQVNFTTYYIDQDQNTVVLMVPEPDNVSEELLTVLAPRLADGSVTIVGGTYEPLTHA